MDIRQLRYFVVVAETGHVTRAAERLGMQQPPLSHQIKLLEQTLGMSLFKRHPRGVALTDAGRQFLDEARTLLTRMDDMRRRMEGVARGERGTLEVGFTSSAGAHRFTPAALRAFRQAYPRVALGLDERNAAELTEAMEQGRLHAALLRVPVARPAGLRFETLLHEPAVAAMPCDHPLAAGCLAEPMRPLALADLCTGPVILVRRPGAPGLYGNLLALCAERGIKPRIQAEVSRMMTNLNLVAAGVGVSIVPASMRGVHAHAVVYAPLDDGGRLNAPLTLVTREGEDSLPALAFASLLRAQALA